MDDYQIQEYVDLFLAAKDKRACISKIAEETGLLEDEVKEMLVQGGVDYKRLPRQKRKKAAEAVAEVEAAEASCSPAGNDDAYEMVLGMLAAEVEKVKAEGEADSAAQLVPEMPEADHPKLSPECREDPQALSLAYIAELKRHRDKLIKELDETCRKLDKILNALKDG